MERFKCLGRYQKGVLLIMIAMVLLFTVLYIMAIGREGFEYRNEILLLNHENGSTVYSGKIQGKQANFTVHTDKTVYFQYDNKTYGPYTAREDSTAIPKDIAMGEAMTGVELRRGEEIIFRGGVLKQGDFLRLYNEDGSIENFDVTVATNYGTVTDGRGNVIDPMEPSVYTILTLMAGPELTHRGDLLPWLSGVFICIATAITILYTDELFHWNLSLQINDADQAEPSDFEIVRRYIAWTVLPLVAMIIFIIGL